MAGDRDAGLSLNHLFLPEVLADPYPFYHRLRCRDPVHWDRHRNTWVLTRYADVVSVLADHRFSVARWTADAPWLPKERRGELGPDYRALPQMMLFADGSGHARMRGLVGRALAGWAGAAMRPRVERLAHGLLDGVGNQGSMDVVADMAYPLPFLVIADVLGIPPEDRGRVWVWSDAHFKLISLRGDELLPGLEGFHQLRAYFRAAAATRRESPGDDLVSALVVAEGCADAPCSEELLTNLALLLTAGHETTTNLIANSLLALLTHPEQCQALRNDPSLMAAAVEELLRYDSPVQMTARLALEDLDIAGRAVERGQTVALMLGAANRDPEQFANPDALDVTRRDNRHVAFSSGGHHCLGAALGRLEGQVALDVVLRRLAGIRLTPQRLEWHRNPSIRSLKSLPVLY
jgi:cytochrome P450